LKIKNKNHQKKKTRNKKVRFCESYCVLKDFVKVYRKCLYYDRAYQIRVFKQNLGGRGWSPWRIQAFTVYVRLKIWIELSIWIKKRNLPDYGIWEVFFNAWIEALFVNFGFWNIKNLFKMGIKWERERERKKKKKHTIKRCIFKYRILTLIYFFKLSFSFKFSIRNWSDQWWFNLK
jgi:hypothetical protein